MESVQDSRCRSLRLPDCSVSNLVYSNSGLHILALAGNVHKLWVWPRDDQIPSAMANATIVPKLWLPPNRSPMINDIGTKPEDVPCFALSNTGYLLSSSGGDISLFNSFKFEIVKRFKPAKAAATCLAFHPNNNNVIIIGMDDSSILVYDVRSDKVMAKLNGHQKRVTGLAFSIPLNALLSAGADARLCLWTIDSWEKKTFKFLKNQSTDTRVQFDEDRIQFLVVQESRITTFKAPKLELLKQWVPGNVITYATYSSESRSIFVSLKDARVGVLSGEALRLIYWINPHSYLPSVRSSRVHPLVIAAHPFDPNQFAMGFSDGAVYVLQLLDSEDKLGSLPSIEKGAGPSTSIAANTDQPERFSTFCWPCGEDATHHCREPCTGCVLSDYFPDEGSLKHYFHLVDHFGGHETLKSKLQSFEGAYGSNNVKLLISEISFAKVKSSLEIAGLRAVVDTLKKKLILNNEKSSEQQITQLDERLKNFLILPHVPKINESIPSAEEADLEYQVMKTRMSGRLDALDFAEVEVVGDGNCQFRALAHQLTGSQDHHRTIKRLVINQLDSHRELYLDYLPPGYTYDNYLGDMRMDAQWGDNITLKAAADYFGVRIFLLTSHEDGFLIEILPETQTQESAVLLSYWAGVHFNSIIQLSELGMQQPPFQLNSDGDLEGRIASLDVLPEADEGGAVRRAREPFSLQEIEALLGAVEYIGERKWKKVKELAFAHSSRTQVDLKDKWKNLVDTAKNQKVSRGVELSEELRSRVLVAEEVATWVADEIASKKES